MMTMTTKDGNDGDGPGSISKFFQRNSKKRSFNETKGSQFPIDAGPRPATVRVTPLSAPQDKEGQSAASATPIDEASSPQKDEGVENDVSLSSLRDPDASSVHEKIPSLSVVTPKSDNENDTDVENTEVKEDAETNTASKLKDGREGHSGKVDDDTKQGDNPFAQFSFQKSTESRSREKGQGVSWRRRECSASSIVPDLRQAAKKAKQTQDPVGSTVTSSDASKSKSGWVRMLDLPPDEQEKVQRKWHTMADPNASLEVRRFQVLVASRLHARCQDTVVRKAMQSLRETFSATDSSSDGGLCAAMVSKADPEVLANVISSIQYYNTKAKHIVKAAQEIQTRFGGKVPESEHSLRQLTGIGPVMADLLAFVNTRAAHKARKGE